MPLVMLVTITPAARALVEISAMAESPRMRLCSLMRSSKKAHSTTTTSVKGIGLAAMPRHRLAMPPRRGAGRKAGRLSAVTKPRAMATVSAPKPTWERPSPIIE